MNTGVLVVDATLEQASKVCAITNASAPDVPVSWAQERCLGLEKGHYQPSSAVLMIPAMLPHPAFSLCPRSTLRWMILPETSASTQILLAATPTKRHLKLLTNAKQSQVMRRKQSFTMSRKVKETPMLRPLTQRMQTATCDFL